MKTVTLVTTRLDPKAYHSAALAEWYRSRWFVETNFAHLKRTLGMDVLRCQSEAGVRRELAMFEILYNMDTPASKRFSGFWCILYRNDSKKYRNC